jgi:hypothetical protein
MLGREKYIQISRLYLIRVLLKLEVATAKMKKYKSAFNDQIPEELIQFGSETLQSEIHKLINSICSKNNFLINGKSLLFYQFTKNTVKRAIVIIAEYHRYQTFYSISFPQG